MDQLGSVRRLPVHAGRRSIHEQAARAVLIALVLGGCPGAGGESGARGSGQAEPTSQPSGEPTSQPSAQEGQDGYGASAAQPVEGGTLYGAALDGSLASVSLAQLLKEPQAYAGKQVRTGGKVARVCQAMGCWMELQEESSGALLRVPMAGHAYFLPQSVAGKSAEIQGEVSLRELSEGQKKHLAAEGAQALASVRLDATGVLVR